MSIDLTVHTVDKLVATYITLREQRAEATRRYEAEDKEFSGALADLSAELLRRAQESGVEGFKTEHGTTYKKVSVKASIADDNIFYNWLRDNDAAAAFLERRVKSSSVASYMEEHEAAPPGLNVFKELTMQVRKS